MNCIINKRMYQQEQLWHADVYSTTKEKTCSSKGESALPQVTG